MVGSRGPEGRRAPARPPDFGVYFFGDYPDRTDRRHGRPSAPRPSDAYDRSWRRPASPTSTASAPSGCPSGTSTPSAASSPTRPCSPPRWPARPSRIRLNAGSVVLPLHDPDPGRRGVVGRRQPLRRPGRHRRAPPAGTPATSSSSRTASAAARRSMYAQLDDVRTLWRGGTLSRRTGDGGETRGTLFTRARCRTCRPCSPRSSATAGVVRAGRAARPGHRHQPDDPDASTELAENIAPLPQRPRRSTASTRTPAGWPSSCTPTSATTTRRRAPRRWSRCPATCAPRCRCAPRRARNSLGQRRIDLADRERGGPGVPLPPGLRPVLRRAGPDRHAGDLRAGRGRALRGGRRRDRRPRRLRRRAGRAARRADRTSTRCAAATGNRFPPLPVARRCRPGQRRIWFLERLLPGRPRYNEIKAIRLDGPLDVPALRTALRGARRPARGAAYRLPRSRGEPRQVVRAFAELDFGMVDGPLQDVLAAESTRRFDLADGPLFVIRLVRLAEAEHVLVLSLHHIVIDAASATVLARDLSAFYGAEASPPRLTSRPSPGATPTTPGNWRHPRTAPRPRRTWPTGAAPSAASCPSWHCPTDRPRPATMTSNGRAVFHTLDPELSRRLRELSRDPPQPPCS